MVPVSLRERLAKVTGWFMQPVLGAKRQSRRLVVRALRSRLFLLVAVLLALPEVWPMVSATPRLFSVPDDSPVLLWASRGVLVLVAAIFLVLVGMNYERLKSRAKRRGKAE